MQQTQNWEIGQRRMAFNEPTISRRGLTGLGAAATTIAALSVVKTVAARGISGTMADYHPIRCSRAPSCRNQAIATLVCGVSRSTCAQNNLPWFMCPIWATSCAAT